MFAGAGVTPVEPPSADVHGEPGPDSGPSPTPRPTPYPRTASLPQSEWQPQSGALNSDDAPAAAAADRGASGAGASGRVEK